MHPHPIPSPPGCELLFTFKFVICSKNPRYASSTSQSSGEDFSRKERGFHMPAYEYKEPLFPTAQQKLKPRLRVKWVLHVIFSPPFSVFPLLPSNSQPGAQAAAKVLRGIARLANDDLTSPAISSLNRQTPTPSGTSQALSTSVPKTQES